MQYKEASQRYHVVGFKEVTKHGKKVWAALVADIDHKDMGKAGIAQLKNTGKGIKTFNVHRRGGLFEYDLDQLKDRKMKYEKAELDRSAEDVERAIVAIVSKQTPAASGPTADPFKKAAMQL